MRKADSSECSEPTCTVVLDTIGLDTCISTAAFANFSSLINQMNSLDEQNMQNFQYNHALDIFLMILY